MSDLICENPGLLHMMCRFGIPLGVAEQTVDQVCARHGVATLTFLAVANFIKTGCAPSPQVIASISVETLMAYLRRAHSYFLDFQFPTIRRKLLEAIVCSSSRDMTEVATLIVRFYDEYMEEVRRHMQHEDTTVFGYVERLLQGSRGVDFEIERFARSHVGTDRKLQELKEIIIKYYTPGNAADLLNEVLYDIFTCEEDLRRHCEVEDSLFVPAVRLLEARIEPTADSPVDAKSRPAAGEETQELSEREKEIVRCVVRGMANKEIATALFISLNTVLTHRKNISRKLNIHSPSGLTIYAIVNGLVDLKGDRLN